MARVQVRAYIYQLVATTGHDEPVPWAPILDCIVSQRIRGIKSSDLPVYYVSDKLMELQLPVGSPGNGMLQIAMYEWRNLLGVVFLGLSPRPLCSLRVVNVA